HVESIVLKLYLGGAGQVAAEHLGVGTVLHDMCILNTQQLACFVRQLSSDADGQIDPAGCLTQTGDRTVNLLAGPLF
ncbi:MAG: hypothetical protein L0228_14380, partial [Planctomycetes bacterium]|nr:hypothetical protein [Planctomycetota bacterium]